MGDQILLPVAFLIGLLFWLTMKHIVAAQQSMKQLQIATYGLSSQARVVAIQRPFMLDDCTRLYFDYLPEGAQEPVRACHVARSADDTLRASLPAAGTVVSIRYLPGEPRQAVIRKLVV